MNLQQIKLFITVSECGTYTKAGEKEGYTQSRVTQMMKSLEEEVGFALFSRSHMGVELTHAGKQLLPRMRQIVLDMDKLESEIEDIKGLTSGTLRIASHMSCSIKWLPPVLKYFRDNYPNVYIEISEAGQKHAVELLHDRSADIALVSGPFEEDKIDFMPIYTDPLVVVFPKGHTFEKYDRVPVAELNGKNFIISSDDFDADSARNLKAMNLDINIDFTSHNDFSIISMVAQHMGISILPKLIIDCANNDSISWRELDKPRYRTLGIGATSLNELGPVENAFISALKKVLDLK
ncbi:MAG: LysR family transcriptional regulator [Firmicutes bacterium]|nr:LysR family transcriptional regulator [Bacillota bacterium]